MSHSLKLFLPLVFALLLGAAAPPAAGQGPRTVRGKVVDDPKGQLLYPTGSGGYMDERTIRWKLLQIADLLEAFPAFNLKRKKARKILAVALARAKCPSPWTLAHDFVRRGAVHCEWIDNSSLHWDEFVPPGRYYLEDPVVVQGYKVYGDADGEVHIQRLRDGLEVVTEQL